MRTLILSCNTGEGHNSCAKAIQAEYAAHGERCEIVDALHRPIPPRTIDGVKRRCTAGMGRCQGGFCGPRVHEIIARELGIPQQDVLKDRAGSYIITGTTKEGGLHHGE